MSAKDVYHEIVKNALIKDGWKITFDPYPIKYEEIKLQADLPGEKTISAQKERRKIVVEIKSFLSRSPMKEFETALGQYLIYQTFLSLNNPDYILYLAIGEQIYEKFFEQVAIKLIIKKYKILILVINIEKQEILEWIN